MKKYYIILLITILILLSIFLISNLGIINIEEHSKVSTKATLDTVALSISIIPLVEEVIVPYSGNVTFLNGTINRTITLITGLTEGWLLNLSFKGTSFPPDWEVPEPTENEVGTRLRYFEIDVNGSSDGGDYKIFFNLSQDELEGINKNDIRLFIFGSKGDKLLTTVLNGDATHTRFSATTTHFSKFLIGTISTVGQPSLSTATWGGRSNRIKKDVYVEPVPEPIDKTEVLKDTEPAKPPVKIIEKASAKPIEPSLEESKTSHSKKGYSIIFITAIIIFVLYIWSRRKIIYEGPRK